MSLTKVTNAITSGAPINVLDYGAVGDGITPDNAAIQLAIDAASAVGSTTRKVRIPYGVAGVYLLNNALFFNTGGITLEWDNNSIVLKKNYNGGMIVVNAAYVTLVNPGLDGNGTSYTGGGVLYNRSDVYFTFGCRIENPKIKDTRDSGVLFYGPRGAPDIVVDGGTIITWQDPAFAGASSSGYPSIRISGAYDGSVGVSPRVFNGITSSSAILLDLTGFNCCKVTNCFTGTILLSGNPDVTGGTPPFVTGENQILNTYIRDGIVLDGFENTIDNCLSHGNAPLTWTAYGGTPATFSSYGWEIAATSQLCKTGPNNVVTNQIIDNGAQGVAVGLMSSSFENGQTWSIQWLATVNPAIGNGSFYVSYDTVGRQITARFRLTIGSTTTLGTGGWGFTIPRWMNLNVPAIGRFNMYRPGIGSLLGDVVLTGSGATHNVGLFDSAAVQLSGAYAGGFPIGTTIDVQITYLRG